MGVLLLLGGGMGWWWLHQAPPLDSELARITRGLTIGQIEQQLGRTLDAFETCTGNRYYIQVPGGLRYGQQSEIEIVTWPHSYDEATKQFTTIAHQDEVCRRVAVRRWSKIGWLNNQPWAEKLLALADD